ncbi:Arsenate reductase and related proteins, glutaredoxin family [plant metagenome]|uniref:Arsenate reductase and related proteins, glutaredoxin family n=1 Tax=plant metagenome TaxID=1297885 RepID=A0A484PSN0_9ZZZZ
MSLTLYGLKACSTVAKARQWLDAHDVAHDFVDYRETPVSPALLKDWAGQLGGWEKLVNRASMTWRNLDESRKSPASDAEWLALIAEYPALVRRPVSQAGDGTVAVGFNEKRYTERFL